MTRQPKILGYLDEDILKELVTLFRHCLPLATKATFDVESQVRIGNYVGILSIRDVLSHLRNILCEKTLTRKKRKVHLVKAEEHFRRAILEPYEALAENELSLIADLESDYFTEVTYSEKLGVKALYKREEITDLLNSFNERISTARESKTETVFEETFAEAAIILKTVFAEAEALRHSMEMMINAGTVAREQQLAEENKKIIEEQAKQIEQLGQDLNKASESRTKTILWSGLWSGAFGTILGVAATILVGMFF